MIALLAGVAHAGVWVHRAGESYAQLVVGHAWSDRVLLDDGSAVPQTDPALVGDLSPLFDHAAYTATELSAYGEIGLGRGFELVGSLPLRSARNTWSLAKGAYPDIVQPNFGLGDLAFGARYGGQRGAWAGSAYLSGTAPLYSNRPEDLHSEAGNSDFEDDRTPLGQGTLNLDAGYGVGVGSAHGWGLAEAGLRIRSQGYSEVVPLRLQGGVHLGPVATWLGADAQLSLGNGSAPAFFRDRWGKGPISVNDQNVLTAELGAQADLWRGLGVTVGASRVVAGQRFPLLTAARAGLTWKGSPRAD